MSEDLRIALVAEGSLMEWEVLHAALKAILAPRTFVLTRLQPDATRPDLGTGWGGVLKWCQQAAARHPGPLSADPTLAQFDALVLHLDADVATMAYSQLRPPISPDEAAARGWAALPCAHACPPASTADSALHAVLLSWLAPANPGPSTVICLPAMNTGAWLAAAVLPDGHRALADLEGNAGIETALAQLPLKQRIRKDRRADVQTHAPSVALRWPQVSARCTRARQFEADVCQVLPG